MRKKVTQLTLRGGEKIDIPLEKGPSIRTQLVTDPGAYIVLTSHNNRVIQGYQIIDINDVVKSTKMWGEPITTPSHLLPGYKPSPATPDSAGYRRFQEMKKQLLRRTSK